MPASPTYRASTSRGLCEYFWQTVPYLARDKRDPEDLDSRGADHAADAARYAVTFETSTITIVESPWD